MNKTLVTQEQQLFLQNSEVKVGLNKTKEPFSGTCTYTYKGDATQRDANDTISRDGMKVENTEERSMFGGEIDTLGAAFVLCLLQTLFAIHLGGPY